MILDAKHEDIFRNIHFYRLNAYTVVWKIFILNTKKNPFLVKNIQVTAGGNFWIEQKNKKFVVSQKGRPV